MLATAQWLMPHGCAELRKLAFIAQFEAHTQYLQMVQLRSMPLEPRRTALAVSAL